MTAPTPDRACIRCDAPIVDSFPMDPSTGPVPANGAVVFTATGNFGSTVFDPDEAGRTLEIVLCDTCLANRTTPVAAWQTEHQIIRRPAAPPGR